MKIDVRERFRYYTGFEPTDDQVMVLEDIMNIDIKKEEIAAGRQSGKTLTTAVGILMWLFDSGIKVRILLVSAQENMLYYHVREIFKNRPELENQLANISLLSPNIIPLKGFELKNGSIVFVRGSTEKNIRGIPADIVIIDEACEVINERILTALGNITGLIAKIILLSTPHVDTSLFVKWTDKGSGFKVHQWSSWGLSWHDKTIDALKKKEMSKDKFAVEVLGRVPKKTERSYFPGKQVDACVMVVDNGPEGGPNSRKEIGIDWGFDSPTVLVMTERIGTTKRKILLVKTWKCSPVETLGPEILEIIHKERVTIVKADSRPPTYKQWFDRYGKGKIQFIDASCGHKDQMFGQLQRMIREKRLIIPHMYVDLVQQLKDYIKKPGGREDDQVDALAYSIYETVAMGDPKKNRSHFHINTQR